MLGVIGLGKLGLPLACVLAGWGHQVVGVDNDAQRIVNLHERRGMPIPEPGVGELLIDHADRLSFSNSPAWLRGAEIVFIVTPTPSLPDGGFSLEYVESAVKSAAPYLDPQALLVVVSTVMPGHMRRLAELVPCGLCYNPQFIALGSVVRDLQQPDFVLIGADRKEDRERLTEFYTDAGLPLICVMNSISAEIAKLGLNCYVTMKISYANMLAEVCDALGANARAVTQAIGLDRRIGAAYLSPGTAYGGPCFPRDNHAFIRAAERAGVPVSLPRATEITNTWQTTALAQRVLKSGAQRVAVLGLAYKPGTPVYEKSAGLALVAALQAAGVQVLAHDPMARPPDVTLAELDEALDWADVLVVTTPWPEYVGLDAQGKHIIDPWGIIA